MHSEDVALPNKKIRIRLGFVDFWGGFEPENHDICLVLKAKYDIVIDNDNPEILFFSCFGYKHLNYRNVIKVFYTGECVVPNYNLCDYSISGSRESMGGRNLYLPIAVRYQGETIPPVTQALAKRNFCNFIYSQDYHGSGAIYRKIVCQELMKYRKVDCPGKVLHNMDVNELSVRMASDWRASKIQFLSKYKFTIAFENSNRDGYITEKLLDSFLAGSVPIYWGSEGNVAPFNKDCMICANDYSDIQSLISRIREVDQDDELYLSICRANPMRTGELPPYQKQLSDFLDEIFQKGTILSDRELLSFDPALMLMKSKFVRAAIRADDWLNSHSSIKNFLQHFLGKV